MKIKSMTIRVAFYSAAAPAKLYKQGDRLHERAEQKGYVVTSAHDGGYCHIEVSNRKGEIDLSDQLFNLYDRAAKFNFKWETYVSINGSPLELSSTNETYADDGDVVIVESGHLFRM